MTAAERRNPKFEWQSAFIESGLTGNAGFIGLLMSCRDNGDGKGFFISAPEIVAMTGLSERAVEGNIRKLRSSEWITVTKRGGRRGDRNFASEYRLSYPSESRSSGATQPADPRASQPADATPQPADASSQPEPSCGPLDQVPVDQEVPLDHQTFSSGEELSKSEWESLPESTRARFMPSFDQDDVMVYMDPGDPPSGWPEPAPGPTDTRPEWKQRSSHNRMLRDEGLDEYGEPLKRKGKR